jgi:hypothetical protein
MSRVFGVRHSEGGVGRWASFAFACLMLVLGGCSGSSGSSTDSGNQGPIIRPPPDGGGGSGPPRVELTVSRTTVNLGDSVSLAWTSSNTAECEASGGWSGSRPIQGQATIGPLNDSATFTLSCTGSAGSAVAMASVDILGVATLRWQAPTQNVDGSALTGLAGYRVYYGSISRSYTDQRSLAATATRIDVQLTAGTYYFAMTAIDTEGNESAYSNEVVRIVN